MIVNIRKGKVRKYNMLSLFKYGGRKFCAF